MADRDPDLGPGERRSERRYLSIDDGGNTWEKLEGNGLPEPPIGKIGIAIAQTNPDVVYALIETGLPEPRRPLAVGRRRRQLDTGELRPPPQRAAPLCLAHPGVDPPTRTRSTSPPTATGHLRRRVDHRDDPAGAATTTTCGPIR